MSVRPDKDLLVEVAEPIYVLTSKAVKAPEKNSILLKRALPIFGDKLEKLIVKYGGNPEVFK